MKINKLFVTVCFMALSFAGFSQYVSNEKSAEEILKERKEIFFQFDIHDVDVKLQDIADNISVDHVEKEGKVIAYANEKGYDFLLANDIQIELLVNPSELIDVKMFDGGTKETYEWDTYPTYESYVEIMYQFATDYPALCVVENIGNSVEGREILVAKISDNVDQDENEPEFFYTATMHGDETAGFVVMMRLIDYLLENYGTDDRITNMVNDMEIFINPAANPDGTYAGGNSTVTGSTRANANGVDLNRNFHDPEDGEHPDGYDYQDENIAMMNFANAHDLVMSANFHGGAEVVNYPWDTWVTRHADDDWFQLISHEYADTAQEYSPADYLTDYDDGITNGYDWYTTSGCRQDYMNYFHSCREVTIEISDVKTIPESELDNHWEYNYRSLLNYIEQAKYGVRGFVSDAVSGDPILGATIEIIGHDQDHSHIYSHQYGEYFRPISAGTYDITFSAQCYETITIEDVTVEDYDFELLDVELTPVDFVADFSATSTSVNIGSDVTFEDVSCGDVVSWEWAFEGGTPATSTEQNPVVVYDEPGTYDVTLTVNDGTDQSTVTKEDYITAAAEFLMQSGEITACQGIFYDDGGADANYSSSADYTLTIYPSTEGAKMVVTFNSFDVEDNSSCSYDWLKIYDGTSTSATQIGDAYCGTNSPGTVTATNEEGALTFEFHSDGSVTGAGWDATFECQGGVHVDDMDMNKLKVYPNPVKDGVFVIENEKRINQVQLITLSGQIVKVIDADDYKVIVDTDNLKKAIYMVKITTDTEVVYSRIQVL